MLATLTRRAHSPLTKTTLVVQKLSVKSCALVTDRGVETVSYYCRGLQHLNIQDVAGVTVQGYRAVRNNCRKCIIEHTNPGFY